MIVWPNHQSMFLRSFYQYTAAFKVYFCLGCYLDLQKKEKEQASSDSNKWMKEWINERIVPWAQCIRNWGAFWRSKWNEKKDGQWRPLWIFFFSQQPLGKSVFIITWMLCIDRQRTTCSIDLYITDWCYRYISRNFMEERARVLFCYIWNIF